MHKYKVAGLAVETPTRSRGIGLSALGSFIGIRFAGSIGPRSDTHPIAGPVRQGPPSRSLRVVDDPSARRKSRFESIFDVVPGDRHIHVHRMSQRLLGIQVLHPNGGSMTEPVGGPALSCWRIAQDGRPKPHVYLFGFGRDRRLQLLNAAFSGKAAWALATAETARASSTWCSSNCHPSRMRRTVKRSDPIVSRTPGSFPSTSTSDSASTTESPIDRTLNTAVAPP